VAIWPRYVQGTHKTYQVTYRAIIDDSWMNIRTEYVIEGGNATLGEAPDYEGHKFVGWSGSGNNITKATTMTAQYETVEAYTITFMIADQAVKTVMVNRGGSAEFPTDDEIRASGYLLANDLNGSGVVNSEDYLGVFLGWSESEVKNVMEDRIIIGLADSNIQGIITGNTVEVTYVVEGEEIYTQTVVILEGQGQAIVASPTRKEAGIEDRNGYTFRWNINEYSSISPGESFLVAGEMTLYGEYQKDYRYDARAFNAKSSTTNCYAYAFDLIRNPETKTDFFPPSDDPEITFAMQPGMWSSEGSWNAGKKYNPYAIGNEDPTPEVCEGALADYVRIDSDFIDCSFEEFDLGMSGGHRVLLFAVYLNVIYQDQYYDFEIPIYDYHWWRLENDGTWSNKHGNSKISSSDVGIVVKSNSDAIKNTKNYYTQGYKKMFKDLIEQGYKDEGIDIYIDMDDIYVDTEVNLVGCFYVKGR